MKFNVDVDCTPEEARAFLGLPDLSPIHDRYVQMALDAMNGQASMEQVEQMFRNLSPLGDAGLKLFSNLMDIGMGTTRPAKKDG